MPKTDLITNDYYTVKMAQNSLNDMIMVRNDLEKKGKNVADLDKKIAIFRSLIESWHLLYSDVQHLQQDNLQLRQELSSTKFYHRETETKMKAITEAFKDLEQ